MQRLCFCSRASIKPEHPTLFDHTLFSMAFVGQSAMCVAIAEHVLSIALQHSEVIVGGVLRSLPAHMIRFRPTVSSMPRLQTLQRHYVRVGWEIGDLIARDHRLVEDDEYEVVVIEQSSDFNQDMLILVACGYLPVVKKNDLLSLSPLKPAPPTSPTEEGEVCTTIEAQITHRTSVLLDDPVVRKLQFPSDGVIPVVVDLVSPGQGIDEGSEEGATDVLFPNPSDWPWKDVGAELNRVPDAIIQVAQDYAIADLDAGKWSSATINYATARDLCHKYIVHAMALGREARGELGAFTGLCDLQWKAPM
jgi:hypothetical protein